MKPILLFALLMQAIVGLSQQSYPTPDLDNIPYRYNRTTNTLEDIERVAVTAQARANGLWGTESVIILAGKTSRIRYNHTDSIAFLIHLTDPKADPYGVCDLNPCTINQKHAQREYEYKQSGAGHAETKNATTPIAFKKVGDGLYLITLIPPVAKGEYFFSIKGAKILYAFGLD